MSTTQTRSRKQAFTPTLTSRETWADRAKNTRLPMWLRVVAYAEAQARPTGHAPLMTGELREALGGNLSAQTISRGIASAIMVGWLHEASSARCLILANGVRDLDCPAIHPASRRTTRQP